MTSRTEVKAESTTDQDRMLMRTVLRRRLNRKLTVYLPLVFAGITGMVLINTFDVRFDMSENLRGTWNVILVVLAAFPLRLAISEIVSYTKDLGNFQIKVAKGIVSSVSGRSLTIGNYQFNLSALKPQTIREGEELELKAGYHTSSVFWLQKPLEASVSDPVRGQT